MPDRVHRERGLRRRTELLRAAMDVIDERGLGATTHRAVAERAGVPPATTTYYFASLDELLEAALELFVSEDVARLEAVGSRVAEHAGTPEAVITAVTAELAGTCSPAQFELYVEASRRPALRATVARSLAAYRGLAERMLERIGCTDPARVAPMVVAYLDGVAVQHIAVAEPGREERMAEGLTALLAPFLTPAPV
jgi:DNA-binding transcriptional regulator YbjK